MGRQCRPTTLHYQAVAIAFSALWSVVETREVAAEGAPDRASGRPMGNIISFLPNPGAQYMIAFDCQVVDFLGGNKPQTGEQNRFEPTSLRRRSFRRAVPLTRSGFRHFGQPPPGDSSAHFVIHWRQKVWEHSVMTGSRYISLNRQKNRVSFAILVDAGAYLHTEHVKRPPGFPV